MMRSSILNFMTLGLHSCLLAGGGWTAAAWDYECHRVVNQLALEALPRGFPAFVFTPEARERIAFLSGEADRWRNQGDGRRPGDAPVLAHFSGPDHYFDLEYVDELGMKLAELPIFRYDFTVQLAAARAVHPNVLEPIDPARNTDHTRELIGFAPWAITEYCGKLRSGFSYLKAFRDYGGTPGEVANAQENLIYIMGVMGHYVGDCSQPLHVTKHHHGWVGNNPHNYTTNGVFHSWVDGGFLKESGGLEAASLVRKIRPAKIVGDPLKPDDLFRQIVSYLQETHKQLEPLYQLEKDGKLSGEPGKSDEGRAFLGGQILKGGQMLGDLWFSAWQQAGEDDYLIRTLKARQMRAAEPKATNP